MHKVLRVRHRASTELQQLLAAIENGLAVHRSCSLCYERLLGSEDDGRNRDSMPSKSGRDDNAHIVYQSLMPRVFMLWSAWDLKLPTSLSVGPLSRKLCRDTGPQPCAAHPGTHATAETSNARPPDWPGGGVVQPTSTNFPKRHNGRTAYRGAMPVLYHGPPMLVHLRPYCQMADRAAGGLRAIRATSPQKTPTGEGGVPQALGGSSGRGAAAKGNSDTTQPASRSVADGVPGGVSSSSPSPSASLVRQLATQRHVLRSGASVQNVCVQEILGRAKMNTVFEVIVIRSDGRTLEPNGGVTASELGLHSRDLSLFARDSRLSPQRATIAVRGDRILFRTEAIKAVIERDQCTLIKNKRDRDFHDIIKPMTLVIEAQPRVPFELSVLEVLLHVTLLYFERRRAHVRWMVDRIVGDAAGGFLEERDGGAGNEGTLGTGDPFGGIGESTVQQFTPLEKVLTAVLNDARETSDAINRFLDDDREVLGTLLLSLNSYSPPPTPIHLPPHDLAAPAEAASTVVAGTADGAVPTVGVGTDAVADSTVPLRRGFGVMTPTIGMDPHQRREMLRNQAIEDASRILETYHREIQSIVGSLLESEDYIESTRETYRMQLDSARNHIILVNLWISVASISLMVATLPSAFYGMNVHHGLEEVWIAFPVIVAMSLGLAVGSYPALLRMFTERFVRQTRQDTRNLMMLRAFLMQHSDDLEAITDALRSLPCVSMEEGGSISREAFRHHMRHRLPRHVTLSDSHLDFLFRRFDKDNDGVLNEAEATLRSKRSYPGAGGSGGRSGSRKGRAADMDWGPGALGAVVGSDGEPLDGSDNEQEDPGGGRSIRGELGAGAIREIGVRASGASGSSGRR
ncbi:hypothetical protein Vretifemale_10273 [Volvox reticuliferus]|uniref:EF-hand domain-containing protein n=1 Tax=Volvox reticuliferus TaxID=1737510 RepID=A0A8J4FRC3_9CHLO|nr:hypothetical protein Vretifemale_10273 [Volvox reticuliferus]